MKIFINEINVVGDFVEIVCQDSKDGLEDIKKFLKIVNLENKEDEPLYGDIIKQNLEKDNEFTMAYRKGLQIILDRNIK